VSIALPDGGCLVTPAEVPRPPVTPVYAASYPGSGAKMTWNLIEALTGLVTGDEYGFSRDGSNVVSLKTHFPHGNGLPPKEDIAVTGQPMKRGFILVRNPRYAIPSLHNFVYEVTNDLPAHSTRAPLDEWRKWRDANVPNQIKAWAKSMEYWMDRLTLDNRILITYESMTDEATGPATAQRLVDFLARDPNVNPVDAGSVECVWRAVVKYHETPHLPSLAAHGIGIGNGSGDAGGEQGGALPVEEGRMLRKLPPGVKFSGQEPQGQAQVASEQVAPELVAAARELAGPQQPQAQVPAQPQQPQARVPAQPQQPQVQVPAQPLQPQAQFQAQPQAQPQAQIQGQPQAQVPPAATEQFSMYTEYAEAKNNPDKAQAQQPQAKASASSMYPEANVQPEAPPATARRLQEVSPPASATVDAAAMDAVQQVYSAVKKLDATRGGHHVVSSMVEAQGLAPAGVPNAQKAGVALQGMVAAPLQLPQAEAQQPPPRELAQAQPLAQAAPQVPAQPVQVSTPQAPPQAGVQLPPPRELTQAEHQAPAAPQAPVQNAQVAAPQVPAMEAQTERVLARNVVLSADAAPQQQEAHPALAAQPPQAQAQAQPPEERELFGVGSVSAQTAIEYARRDQRRAKEALVLARREEKTTGEKSTLETQAANDRNARHRADNHPALPSSFRSGPVTKPYTRGQIRLMVEVMEALKSKYKEDEQLVRVLNGYINDVKSMPGE